MQRECDRYGLEPGRVAAALKGEDPLSAETPARSRWELLVVAAALGLFIWLALGAERQPIAVNLAWMILLAAATLMSLIVCGAWLWKRTRFS